MTRGPSPKPGAARRNKHSHAAELAEAPREGRSLPRALGVQTAGARRFWRTWATSPQSALWTETDWAELEITVRLVDAFFQGETRHAGEIRMRTAKWGATVEDRARLRMTLKDGPATSATDEADTPETPDDSDLDEELFHILNQ